MLVLTEKQKKTLQNIRTWYCSRYAEDPIDGSNFDCSILDLLEDEIVEKQMNKAMYRNLGTMMNSEFLKDK